MDNPTILCSIPVAIIGGILFFCMLCAFRLSGIISEEERKRGKDV